MSGKPSSLNLQHRRPGTCRYCKCKLLMLGTYRMVWHDAEGTVCTRIECVLKFNAARLKKVQSLLKVGLDKQKMNALSCYHEAAVIVEALVKELP